MAGFADLKYGQGKVTVGIMAQNWVGIHSDGVGVPGSKAEMCS